MSITAILQSKKNATMHLNLWGHTVFFLQMNQLAKTNQKLTNNFSSY